jgi:hypothetical protein
MLIGETLANSLMADSTAAPLLDGTKPIIILTGQDPPYDVSAPFAPAAWDATYMIRFASEADMQSVFTANGIPSFVAWVMYDNEPDAQPPTPPDEQPPNDPAPYYAAGAKLAHANGKLFAATAGLNGTAAQTQDVYNTSTAWDFYAVQTQTGELNLKQFDANIVNTMDSIWAVNPAVPFSAGVGDYANGQLVNASQIDPAMESIPSNGSVWMNFGPNAASTTARYDIAASVIENTVGQSRAAPITPP